MKKLMNKVVYDYGPVTAVLTFLGGWYASFMSADSYGGLVIAHYVVTGTWPR